MRRFFIFDTISGYSEANTFTTRQQAPKYVRWASSIKFRITLDPALNERIYTPFVEITYRERSTASINEGSRTSVAFLMDYFKDMADFWSRILTAFIIFQVVIVVIIGVRLAAWLKQNPRALLPGKFGSHLAFRVFYLLFDVWSGIMFWIIFFTAGYWFVFYKLQENAYLLLPSVDEWDYSYQIFDAIFGIVLAFRFLAIMMAIWD